MSNHDSTKHFSRNAKNLKPSAIDAIHKLLEQPGIRSLAGAWPDPALFPSRVIGSAIDRLLTDKGDMALQYCSTRGLPELRQALADWAAEHEGVRCSASQILITSGSAQGLDLACRMFIDPGDMVLVGLPSYFGATATIASQGGINRGIPLDEDGIQTEAMEEALISLQQKGLKVKAAYVIPNFQNPSGVTLSLERRKELVALAQRYEFMIFEDDPYGELRFEGERLPSLLALDTSGWVVHLHSTSKTFAPGMRVAWVAGNTDVITCMERFKQATDISSNSLSQYVLLELIRSGDLAKAIAVNIDHYRKKRDLMLGLMEEHFPHQVKWTRPSGGFFTFVTLPSHLDSTELLQEATKHQIAYISGPAFFVDGGGQQSFRLSFSQAPEEDIRAVIPRLGELIDKRLQA